MNKKTVIEALAKLRKESPKKKFTQTIDLIISLKGLDTKKGDKIDDYIVVPYGNFRKIKFCALVGKELAENAKKNCDTVIVQADFDNWNKTPREIKKLVRKHDLFFAQLNIMPDIARVFGKYLGSKGKMPNPKLGQVIPPNGDIAQVKEKMGKTIILKTKNQPNIHTIIGNETMKDEQIAENAAVIIEKISHDLTGNQQIKGIYVKMTMSKPVKLE